MGRESLQASVDKLSMLALQSNIAANEFIQRMNVPQAEWDLIGKTAAAEMDSTIRGMLVRNLQSSGINRRSGTLERNVRDSQIIFDWTQKHPSMKAVFRSGEDPYEYRTKSGKVNKSDFYEVSAALNFGAVIVSKRERRVLDTPTNTGTVKRADIIGAKAKRSLKKKLLKVKMPLKNQAARDRALARGYKTKKGGIATKGYNFGTAAKTTDKSITTGGGEEKAVVIRPKPFFRFTAQQSKEIGARMYAKMRSLAYSRRGLT